MSRSIVFSLMIVTGCVGGTRLVGDGLPLQPAPLSAAEAQPAPPSTETSPAPPTEQPGATERGLPGQALPQKPGMATPGGQPPIQKVPILPKLQASPPPPAKGQPPPRSPAAATQRSPSLSEIVSVLGSLPGGVEAIEDAKTRGAKIQSAAGSGIYLANPGPWSVTLSPRFPKIGSAATLALDGLRLNGFIGNFYFFDPTIPTDRQPSVEFTVRVPRDGWYMMNFEVGSRGGKATLKKWDRSYFERGSPNPDYRTIYRFTFPSNSNRNEYRHSLPELFELAAGYHAFMLLIDGGGKVEFFEVSLTEFER